MANSDFVQNFCDDCTLSIGDCRACPFAAPVVLAANLTTAVRQVPATRLLNLSCLHCNGDYHRATEHYCGDCGGFCPSLTQDGKCLDCLGLREEQVTEVVNIMDLTIKDRSRRGLFYMDASAAMAAAAEFGAKLQQFEAAVFFAAVKAENLALAERLARIEDRQHQREQDIARNARNARSFDLTGKSNAYFCYTCNSASRCQCNGSQLLSRQCNERGERQRAEREARDARSTSVTVTSSAAITTTSSIRWITLDNILDDSIDDYLSVTDRQELEMARTAYEQLSNGPAYPINNGHGLINDEGDAADWLNMLLNTPPSNRGVVPLTEVTAIIEDDDDAMSWLIQLAHNQDRHND